MVDFDTEVSGICNDRSQSISLLGMMQRTKGIAQRREIQLRAARAEARMCMYRKSQPEGDRLHNGRKDSDARRSLAMLEANEW